MIDFYESRENIVGYDFPNAEVASCNIGYFCVIVDGEEVGGCVETLHSSEVIRHEYVTIIITILFLKQTKTNLRIIKSS